MLRAGLLLCVLCPQWRMSSSLSAQAQKPLPAARTHLPDAAAVLESYVIRPILEAAQDYSTDDRCGLLHPSLRVFCKAPVLCDAGILKSRSRLFFLLLQSLQALLPLGRFGMDLRLHDGKLCHTLPASWASMTKSFSFPVLRAGVMWAAGYEKQQ